MKRIFERWRRSGPARHSEAAGWRLLDMVYADPAPLWFSLVLVVVLTTMMFVSEEHVWAWWRLALGSRAGLGAAGWGMIWAAVWGGAGFGLAVFRLIDFRTYPRRRAASTLPRLRRRFTVIMALVGVYWGLGGLVVLVSGNPSLHMWVINALTAALCLSVARFNPVLEAVQSVVVISLVPFVLCCLLTGNPYLQLYAVMALLYMSALLAVGRDLFNKNVQLLTADEEKAASLRREFDINAQLEDANHRLEAMATTDGLTGIANRRCFDDAMRQFWRRALRKRTYFYVLLVDIDHFKEFNDAFGHQAGDACLQAVAKQLAAMIRSPSDLAARYGGEEFAVVIADTDRVSTMDVGERLRRAVEAMGMAAPDGGVVTISVGAAVCRPGVGGDGEEAEAMGIGGVVAAADAYLYEAKRAGRNCVRGEAEGVGC